MFASELHSSSQPKNQVQGAFLLDVIVRQSSPVLELFARENESLLIRRNALFVLNFGLDAFDGVRRFDLQRNGFSGESFDKNLHLWFVYIINTKLLNYKVCL